MTMNGMMNSSTSTNQFLKSKVSEFCSGKIHSLFYFFTFSLFTFYHPGPYPPPPLYDVEAVADDEELP